MKGSNINLYKLTGCNFSNLIELDLTSNNIKDISPLFKCKFPILSTLILADNPINNNEVINLLEELDLPNLINLNLYKTGITDLKIFKLVIKYKKLIILKIGENKFDYKNDKESFYQLPELLEEFGITGCFEGDDANFIRKLGIENLKIFYFSRNKINNLKYLEKVKFEKLEEFWAISNRIADIKEIMYLNKKENIKIINLKENYINNFNELFDIINNFPKLEKLGVIGNDKIKEEDVEEMKIKIKNKYNRNLEIIFKDESNN